MQKTGWRQLDHVVRFVLLVVTANRQADGIWAQSQVTQAPMFCGYAFELLQLIHRDFGPGHKRRLARELANNDLMEIDPPGALDDILYNEPILFMEGGFQTLRYGGFFYGDNLRARQHERLIPGPGN